MSEKILRLENITMQFGGVIAVNNMNLEVGEGEIVSLIGPNGAGKTTAFNVITGVYQPTNGAVWYRGEKIVENYPQGKMRKLYKGEHAGEYTHALAPTPDKITRMGMEVVKVLAWAWLANMANRPPPTPAKKELMQKAIRLCLARLMPMASAATSSSRMALKARP